VDILELFPIDFELTPSERLRLREVAGGELAVIRLDSLSAERRRGLSQSLGQALVSECSAMRLEDALPGLSTLAIPLVQHGARTAADLARLSLDEIGLWLNIDRALQREAAAAAVDALTRGALEHGTEAARDALRLSLRERAVERTRARAPERR
jgi:hypothetical protein